MPSNTLFARILYHWTSTQYPLTAHPGQIHCQPLCHEPHPAKHLLGRFANQNPISGRDRRRDRQLRGPMPVNGYSRLMPIFV